MTSRSRRLRAALLASAMLLASSLVPAALAQDATILAPLPVTADAPRGSLTVPDVAQQRTELEKTAGSVGFVDAEAYRGSFANTLRDVLQDSPGVYVQERYGQELRLSVRGSGAARTFHLRGLEVLQDGIPVNLADGSGDFYQIDPLSLRSAEIYKGGNGLAYGSSYLGGAINFVTPTAHTAVAPNILRLEGGSFGTLRSSAQASRVIGNADYLFNVSLTNVDGWRDHSKQESLNLNANVGYRFDSGVETRFYLGNYFVDQRLPGALSRAQALESPEMASAAALAGDQARVVHVQRLANRTSFVLGGGKLDVDSWAIYKNLFHPIFQVVDQEGWTWGVAPRWTGEFSLGGMRDELIVGARWFAGRNEAKQYLNVGGSRGAFTANALQEASNLEAYVENRLWFMPTVALMTGAKLIHAERELTNYVNAVRSGDRTYDEIAPKLGLLWQPRETIQVFADVTRSVDVPDFSDLAQPSLTPGFTPLDAQNGWTAEIGSRGRHGPYAWDVTAYRAWVRDQLIQYTTDASLPAATRNADRTILQGLEVGASAGLGGDLLATGDMLRLGGVWTWNDFRYDGDRHWGDNRIAGVPQHVIRGTLTYAHPSGVYVAPSIDWVPQGAYADQANTLQAPSYALLGLKVGWDMPNGLSLFLDGRNLTDKRYISDISTIQDASAPGANLNIFYPGTGRSVYAGLRAAF